MFRTRAIVLLLAVPTLVLTAAGCDDEEKATPQIIFDGRTELGKDNDCRDTGALFTIGDFGNQASTPKVPSRAIADGERGFPDPYDQGNVSVSCSVVPAGSDEFDVRASVDLAGATGGFFRVDGKFKTTGDQNGIHAQFSSRKSTNTYEQRDRACIVRYTTPFQGVAAGRIWGEIVCPKAENIKTQDGTACEAIAQFRFENCAQE